MSTAFLHPSITDTTNTKIEMDTRLIVERNWSKKARNLVPDRWLSTRQPRNDSRGLRIGWSITTTDKESQLWSWSKIAYKENCHQLLIERAFCYCENRIIFVMWHVSNMDELINRNRKDESVIYHKYCCISFDIWLICII